MHLQFTVLTGPLDRSGTSGKPATDLTVRKGNSMVPGVGRFLGEIARAHSTLKNIEVRLQVTRSLLAERKTERYSMDCQRHVLERTGDINKLMELKSRSVILDKSIAELTAAEYEWLIRIESSKRYLKGLDDRLASLQREAAGLSEKLSSNEVPPDLVLQVRTTLKRVQMQIESLAGAV